MMCDCSAANVYDMSGVFQRNKLYFPSSFLENMEPTVWALSFIMHLHIHTGKSQSSEGEKTRRLWRFPSPKGRNCARYSAHSPVWSVFHSAPSKEKDVFQCRMLHHTAWFSTLFYLPLCLFVPILELGHLSLSIMPGRPTEKADEELEEREEGCFTTTEGEKEMDDFSERDLYQPYVRLGFR